MSVGQAERAIRVKELKEQADDILRRVRDNGEIINVADGDAVVAQIVPISIPRIAQSRQAIWERRQKLIEDIAKAWPEGVSAADAVADVRRDL